MAHTIKTLEAGDITRKGLSILHNKSVFCKTINRQYDPRFAKTGAKNGGVLLIREPNQFTVRSGATIDTQDVTEATKTLTVATQRGVDVNFSSVELTLSLDDFADRILEPAMARLAAEIDKVVIAAVYPYVANYMQTTAGTQPGTADLLGARAQINQKLAPLGNRTLMCDSLAANSIITSNMSFYHPASDLSRQYNDAMIGRIYGFDFYETETVPTHTAGTRTDTTPTCSITLTSTSIEDGVAVIAITAMAASTTFKAGDVFIIVGLNDVNPETKATCAWLKHWSVTADTNVTTGLTEYPVSPTPYRAAGAKQNCVVVTGTVAAAVICSSTVRSTGVAGAQNVNNLAYHRDAFTLVTADLEMPSGVDFAAREVYDGISLRIVRQYDIVNDKFPCRMDVLFGQLATRPEWASRIPA